MEKANMNAPVTSPCIGVCMMDDAAGFCVGCGRTLDEIGAWSDYGDADKIQVKDRAAQRLKRLSDDG